MLSRMCVCVFLQETHTMLNHEGKLDQPVKVYRNLRHTWGIVEVQSHAGEITRWQEMTSRRQKRLRSGQTSEMFL